ncbi:lasso peptide biosynthesis PqqD family chaperone [Streptomyces tuirus]|uniref:Lasso peptide biosynthesis PqqD family chaperone n=1 Tax=Streptomyces tuirus TaxID=68278 RepID=A0A941FEG8_9ACTN|nr:lasso peptide biosynthesis PqqD family chaperone [Streptomyces tuirus]
MPLSLHPDVTMAETEDGAVLLHQRTGRYWQLNRTGVLVLRRLINGDSREQAANKLVVQHRADPEDARNDVFSLVDQLRAAHLVRES